MTPIIAAMLDTIVRIGAHASNTGAQIHKQQQGKSRHSPHGNPIQLQDPFRIRWHSLFFLLFFIFVLMKSSNQF